ncbi:Alpha,alpha-trehalose-phosphate synthase (UDP-forming) 1 [Hordeum vulgare]|nr:Alpha,alpha-trehalose-phosphate synthase (UDP-forming) 1 [Hordeum vulgare]
MVRFGDKVPADMHVLRLVWLTLRVEQRLLTGETNSVNNTAHAVPADDADIQAKDCMVFAGTTVVNGSAVCLVVQTGMATETSKIHSHIHVALQEDDDTPLKKKLNEFDEALTEIIGLVCILVWLIKVIIGVDRLDMIKGFLQKVLAFEKFLEENEELDSEYKVVLLQIAVPTKSDVPEYRKLASHVHELVARVNGRFRTLKATPILHLVLLCVYHFYYYGLLFNCESFLCFSHVPPITSLRDGMNLLSYEYVACQESKKGVLILGEFAGAAQSLGVGAITLNPWDIAEVAGAIKHALDMPSEAREKHHSHNYELVSRHTAQDWVENYVCDLNDAAGKAPLQAIHTDVLPIEEAATQYVQSNNRLLILVAVALAEVVLLEPQLRMTVKKKGTLSLCHPPIDFLLKLRLTRGKGFLNKRHLVLPHLQTLLLQALLHLYKR